MTHEEDLEQRIRALENTLAEERTQRQHERLQFFVDPSYIHWLHDKLSDGRLFDIRTPRDAYLHDLDARGLQDA